MSEPSRIPQLTQEHATFEGDNVIFTRASFLAFMVGVIADCERQALDAVREFYGIPDESRSP